MTKIGYPELISHTTRKPRVFETEGVSYYFITDEQYDRLSWVEKEEYCGNRYGSSVNEVLGKLADNAGVCVAVTYKGYLAYRRYFKDWENVNVIAVNVKGGTKEDLEARMIARGDKEEKIKERLKKYDEEQIMFQGIDFDWVFDNTGLEENIPEETKKLIDVYENN